MPPGADYAAYARHMPYLTLIGALTTCQVFYTNAEVSAGRFGFLWWLAPLHIAYPAALTLAAKMKLVGDMDTILAWFGAAAALRFAFACGSLVMQARPARPRAGWTPPSP